VPTVTPDRPPRRVIGDLEVLTKELPNLKCPPGARARNDLRKRLEQQVVLLREAAGRLDPILKPLSLFDPGDPQTSASVVALAPCFAHEDGWGRRSHSA
jgi:hypothetical protein